MALEVIAPHSMFSLEVANDRLNSLAAFEPATLAGSHALEPPPVVNRNVGQITTPIAQIDDRFFRFVVSENADLLKLLGQRMTVVRIARKASRPDDQVAGGRDGDADLDAELVRLTGLADARDLPGVPGVKLVLVLGPQVHQPFSREQKSINVCQGIASFTRTSG